LNFSAGNTAAGKTIDGLHQAAEWSLLVLVLAHIAAAIVHLLYQSHHPPYATGLKCAWNE
jgi:cytochrome b561